jgi:hypothetical protein
VVVWRPVKITISGSLEGKAVLGDVKLFRAIERLEHKLCERFSKL